MQIMQEILMNMSQVFTLALKCQRVGIGSSGLDYTKVHINVAN